MTGINQKFTCFYCLSDDLIKCSDYLTDDWNWSVFIVVVVKVQIYFFVLVFLFYEHIITKWLIDANITS